MTYVVTQACIGTKDRSCVEVCPVDCFYNYDNQDLNRETGKEPRNPGDFGMLIIHPDECIHCGACMINPMEMNRRIVECHRRGVPITNYGMSISLVQGVLDRVVAPLLQAMGKA